MASPAQPAATDPTSRNFSQVVFTDIPHSYPPATPVTCCFTLAPAFQPSSRDWVGIFKVGWSTTKEYHTFVWVEPCVDQQTLARQAVFKEYYLPKDEIEFYQFCYIDGGGQVRGASTPFCFRNQENSMENLRDDDLLVITTQEQVEQSVREKAELQKDLDLILMEKETLTLALETQQQQFTVLKGESEEKEKEKQRLQRDMEQMKEENESLKLTLEQKIKEMDQLQGEIVSQMATQMKLKEENEALQQKTSESLKRDEAAAKQNETLYQQKYDQAVLKINQLKEEKVKLTGEVQAQAAEINTLNIKGREDERELGKMKDNVQLLQVDLHTLEKDKQRFSTELQRLQTLAQDLDQVKGENQDLRRRLTEQEELQESPHNSLMVQCQTLSSQLQETQGKLSSQEQKFKDTKARADFLEREVDQLRIQMDKVNRMFEQETQKNGKQNLNLMEVVAELADKTSLLEEKEKLEVLLRKEKEDLMIENQELMRANETLRGLVTDQSASSSSSSPAVEPPHPQEDTTTSYLPEHVYANIDDQEEEPSLVCRHCQERFPCITQQELEQHEESHRLCPFCPLIFDNVEQSVFEDHVYSHEV